MFADTYMVTFFTNVADVKDGLHTIYKQSLKIHSTGSPQGYQELGSRPQNKAHMAIKGIK